MFLSISIQTWFFYLCPLQEIPVIPRGPLPGALVQQRRGPSPHCGEGGWDDFRKVVLGEGEPKAVLQGEREIHSETVHQALAGKNQPKAVLQV